MSRHIVILHRWAAPYALYQDYIDHTAERVSYITTAVGVAGVPEQAAAVRLVTATDDLDEVEQALVSLEHAVGNADAVIALKEDDLLVAAALRARRGLPGWTEADLRVFRDKLAMARAVATTGEDQPVFAAADSASAVAAFGETHGWPVVLKPRFGSSSAGVTIVHAADAAALDLDDRVEARGAHLVQTPAIGDLVHVDGIHAEGRLPVWRAHRYLQSPLSFRSGGWIGSVEIDDSVILERLHDHTLSIVSRLARGRATVFHLETFVRFDGPRPTCTFLEVGARVGGAEIPLLWRDLHGHDLMGSACRLALGEPLDFPTTERPHHTGARGGLLLVASPTRRPCRITSSQKALDTDWAPAELYGEDVVANGEIISDAAAYYEHVAGRYRFRGHDTASLERAVYEVARRIRIEGQEMPADQPGRVPA